MLVNAPALRWNAGMSKAKKRTRITAKKANAAGITITEKTKRDGDYTWNTYFVQGWKEDGKWQRKQFKDRAEAERFVALKRVKLENQGREQKLMLCPLSQERLDEAVRAFDTLGDTYTLDEAVRFFLRHHRAPDYTIELSEAVKTYLEEREQDGVRPRTITQMRSTLQSLTKHAGDPKVHEVTKQTVEAFLRSLRTKDGTGKATYKTWNNYRNDLHKFFDWCAESDKATERPWTFENPVSQVRKFTSKQVREQQNATVITTAPEDVQHLLTVLMRWRKGALVRYYAYLYFAGIRPDELSQLSDREEELVNLRTGIITIPADISKTRHPRHVTITKNLREWLKATKGKPIVPVNFDRIVKRARKNFKLTHDEARHSFISFHVALHRSVGDAALQAGNSESIIRRHYLNLHPAKDGEEFFSIIPDVAEKKAVFMQQQPEKKPGHLKAI